MLPPDCVQLILELDDVRLRIPWEGRSPRVLTRVARSLIFKAGAVKKDDRNRDPTQLDLFLVPDKGPFVYEGAPLLLELERAHA